MAPPVACAPRHGLADITTPFDSFECRLGDSHFRQQVFYQTDFIVWMGDGGILVRSSLVPQMQLSLKFQPVSKARLSLSPSCTISLGSDEPVFPAGLVLGQGQ